MLDSYFPMLNHEAREGNTSTTNEERAHGDGYGGDVNKQKQRGHYSNNRVPASWLFVFSVVE